MITDFTNITSEISKFSLDLLSMQHSHISNNIANANTQNYHPSKINFSSIYDEIDKQINSGVDITSTLSGLKNDLQSGEHVTISKVEGVELDYELVGMSKNTIMYKALLSALSSRGDFMKIVLNSGR